MAIKFASEEAELKNIKRLAKKVVDNFYEFGQPVSEEWYSALHDAIEAYETGTSRPYAKQHFTVTVSPAYSVVLECPMCGNDMALVTLESGWQGYKCPQCSQEGIADDRREETPTD
jgi:predicted RNA-binding Zn-ribbon protein involved in translation (DUF1610 family)